MDITALAPAAQQGGLSRNTAALNSDFDTFLKMLTTQMQHQDPFNPMEATDFAVQLATFSSVEQQARTNTLLEGLAAQAGVADLAGVIGLSVRAPVAGLYAGDPLDVVFAPARAADHNELVVRNAMGRVVDTVALPADATQYSWPGLGEDGMPLPFGAYSFELVSYAGDDILSSSPAETYAQVVEARRDPSGTVLVLAGGAEIATEDVRALRRPSP
ncbi:flagellar hook capping FlgD N-terminal domain-containing protein [Alkalilacustris brevis]|uniref:flagellar hook capping FlgD N-terminal domain-containing protein n=1 Tax=Alkalilacustris brevis TaxID=2026338 RepID=UPI00138FC9D5|nr:flagellar hook capping FlgD N-terminal domain-containing protein [Alkalilacustris brevis]